MKSLFFTRTFSDLNFVSLNVDVLVFYEQKYPVFNINREIKHNTMSIVSDAIESVQFTELIDDKKKITKKINSKINDDRIKKIDILSIDDGGSGVYSKYLDHILEDMQTIALSKITGNDIEKLADLVANRINRWTIHI